MRNLGLFRNNEFFPNVRQWRPFLQEIDDVFSNLAEQPSWNATQTLELEEQGNHYVTQFDMPGIGKENIDVEVVGNRLTVKGEKKIKAKEGEGAQAHSRSFVRTLVLPTGIKTDAIEASYQDGVLTLILPKVDEVKPRKITVGETNQIEAH